MEIVKLPRLSRTNRKKFGEVKTKVEISRYYEYSSQISGTKRFAYYTVDTVDTTGKEYLIVLGSNNIGTIILKMYYGIRISLIRMRIKLKGFYSMLKYRNQTKYIAASIGDDLKESNSKIIEI